MLDQNTKLNTIERCTRYAFMPNRLHLCGPENQADVLEFYSKINQGKNTKTIQPLLEKFTTLYPYLKLIARANNVKNPLDAKIVDAYWLGNSALENIPAASLFNYLTGEFNIKKRLGFKEFFDFKKKFNLHVLPHHNFHVFSVYQRTGKTETPHTLATMDACRISWGRVKKIKSHSFIVETRPLELGEDRKIKEANFFIEREILNYFEGNKLLTGVMIGNFISIHWGCACEILSKEQANRLQKFTELSLLFAVNP